MSSSTIVSRVRAQLQSYPLPFEYSVTADGQTSLFEIPSLSISETYPVAVTFNPSTFTATWNIDYKHAIIYFAAPPPAGTVMTVQGYSIDFFTDSEIFQAVQDAFTLHTSDQNPPQYLDPLPGQKTIPQVEEYLVANLAIQELLWGRATAASQEIDVTLADGVSIPREQRYRQILQHIQALAGNYKEWAGALGVGLFRIEIFTLRRISYTTNRLVPVYQEVEYDQPYAGFYPTQAPPGAYVQIFGYNLSGAIQVLFGTVPSPDFSVTPGQNGETDVVIAQVPLTGLTIGQAVQIGVTTASGTTLSSAAFVVGQGPPQILYGREVLHPPIPPGV